MKDGRDLPITAVNYLFFKWGGGVEHDTWAHILQVKGKYQFKNYTKIIFIRLRGSVCETMYTYCTHRAHDAVAMLNQRQ